MLTYYNDAAAIPLDGRDSPEDPQPVLGPGNRRSRSDRQPFNKNKANLEKLAGELVRKNNSQLIMLLHGPGGSGKSEVIKHVEAYCRQFCGNIGAGFTHRTIVVTALSGAAASSIDGETVHGAMGLNRRKTDSEFIEVWDDTRLLIIDEISFASKKLVKSVYDKLKVLRPNSSEHYGGLCILFCGDFRQLVPIGEPVLYKEKDFYLFHGLINCYIELHGLHRYKDDPEYGQIMLRFRQGQPTLVDFQTINSRRVRKDGCTLDGTRLPAGIKYAIPR